MPIEADNDRLLASISRTFIKPKNKTGVTGVWNELRAENVEIKYDGKTSEANANGMRVRVGGVKDVSITIKAWFFESINIKVAPFRLVIGESFEIQHFETSPPVDSRKLSGQFILASCNEGNAYNSEGARMADLEFQSSGKVFLPGQLLSSPSTYFGSTYAAINPDGDPSPMDINSES